MVFLSLCHMLVFFCWLVIFIRTAAAAAAAVQPWGNVKTNGGLSTC